VLYFVLLVLFLILFVGPVIVFKFMDSPTLGGIPAGLLQPTGQNNNDTLPSVTGSVLVPGLAGGDPTGSSGDSTGGGGGGGGGDSTATASADDAFGTGAFGLGGGGRFVRW
jgi:hypothetical protein